MAARGNARALSLSYLAVTPRSARPLLGIAFMLGTYLCFAILDSSVKWLSFAGLATLQLAFARYFGHVAISALLIARGGRGKHRFWTDRPWLVVTRGVLLMLSTVFNFLALRYLPLTMTATIMFAAPILICALSGPFLGERVGPWRWSAIALGFIGILVAIRPFDADFHWAVSLSLASTTCFAFYTVLTRKLSGEVAIDTLQLYAGLVGAIVLLPFALAYWVWPANTVEWVLLISLGLVAWIGHEFLTRAHGYAEASMLTPFSYVFLIYMTASSYLVFDQPPDRWTLVGAGIVVAAGLVIWMRERKRTDSSA